MSTTSAEELQARAESVRRLTLQAVDSLTAAKTAALQLAKHARTADLPATFSYAILDAAEGLANDVDVARNSLLLGALDRTAQEIVALTEALLRAADEAEAA